MAGPNMVLLPGRYKDTYLGGAQEWVGLAHCVKIRHPNKPGGQ